MKRRKTYKTPATKAAADANRRRNIEKARAAGLMNRQGVPNGWTKPQADDARRNAQREAEWLLPVIVPDWIDPIPKEALGVVLSIARDQSARPRLRLAAARTVLEYTVAIPVGTRIPSGKQAAEWLEGIAQAARARRGD